MMRRFKRFVAIGIAGIMLFSNVGELALAVKASEASEPAAIEETRILEEPKAVKEIEEQIEISEGEPKVVSEGEAADNYCGNTVTWTLKDGVLTISGTGEMFNYKKVSATPWYANAAEITSVVIEDGVTTVAAYGFREFAALESVVIGNDVTSINQYAFYKCTALQSVILGSSVTSLSNYAFYNDSGITELTVPNQECKLYSSAFTNVNPKKIKIRKDAESISLDFLNGTNMESFEMIDPAVEGAR